MNNYKKIKRQNISRTKIKSGVLHKKEKEVMRQNLHKRCVQVKRRKEVLNLRTRKQE